MSKVVESLVQGVGACESFCIYVCCPRFPPSIAYFSETERHVLGFLDLVPQPVSMHVPLLVGKTRFAFAIAVICPFWSSGFLIGGDVLRLLYGHMDECLTVPSGQYGEEHRR